MPVVEGRYGGKTVEELNLVIFEDNLSTTLSMKRYRCIRSHRPRRGMGQPKIGVKTVKSPGFQITISLFLNNEK